MYGSEARWRDVDEYFVSSLVDEDEALVVARASARAAGLPDHEVAPNQGALLSLIARIARARRVLEIGTLGGYSTIWLARAVGAVGHVTTLEIDPGHARLAVANLSRAGVADRVDVVVGPARDSLRALVEQQVAPFDLVFIDADKPSNPHHLRASLALTAPGSVIIADNVVRNGAVADPGSDDDRVRGVREFIAMVAADPRLEATALQTVGSKGWDGFTLIRVR